MSDSRYAPPRAAVADLEPAHPLIPRPAQVARALRWLWASFGLDLMISTWVWFNTTVLALPERVGSALGQIVFALITVWAYRAVAKGRNWARNLVAGLTVLGVIVVAATLWARIPTATPCPNWSKPSATASPPAWTSTVSACCLAPPRAPGSGR